MTFIIAEVGSNWSTFEDCLDSITFAKFAGADAVKFQLFTAEELYGYCPEGWDRRYELPRHWIPQLKAMSDHVGIEFMCTAFSPYGVRFIDPYVKRHKIASSDITALDILQAVAETNKPVIMSMGAALIQEISKAKDYFKDVDLTLLYCVAAYPAHIVDLRAIDIYRDEFSKCNIGYSDHTKDTDYIPWAAVHRHGATVIEKHVNFVNAKGPDANHSLNFDQFKRMVKIIREKTTVLIAPHPEENDMHIWHKRRKVEIGGKSGFYRIFKS